MEEKDNILYWILVLVMMGGGFAYTLIAEEPAPMGMALLFVSVGALSVWTKANEAKVRNCTSIWHAYRSSQLWWFPLFSLFFGFVAYRLISEEYQSGYVAGLFILSLGAAITWVAIKLSKTVRTMSKAVAPSDS